MLIITSLHLNTITIIILFVVTCHIFNCCYFAKVCAKIGDVDWLCASMTDEISIRKSRINLLTNHTRFVNDWFDLIFGILTPLSTIFHYIMATSFSGGGNRSTRREPPTMGKQLVNFITCGCESSAPFFVIYKDGREPTPYWW